MLPRAMRLRLSYCCKYRVIRSATIVLEGSLSGLVANSKGGIKIMEESFLTLHEFILLGCNFAVPAGKDGEWLVNSYAKYRSYGNDYFMVAIKDSYWLVHKDTKPMANEVDLLSFLMTHREEYELALRPVVPCYPNGEPMLWDRTFFFEGESCDQFGAIRVQHDFGFLYRNDETNEYGYTEQRFSFPSLIITARYPNIIPSLLDGLKLYGKIKIGNCFYRFLNERWEVAYDLYGEAWQSVPN